MPNAADVAARLLALFLGSEGAHGTHGVPEVVAGEPKASIQRTARTVRGPATEAIWQDHIDGKTPLGVIPIRQDSTCLWGAIDYDVYDADLVSVIARVRNLRLPLVPSRSKSGGLHLWLFLLSPQPAPSVIAVLTEMAAHLGIAGSEIFPKQSQLIADHGDVGNWIVMPYFGNTYDGLIFDQSGLSDEGGPIPVDVFLARAESSRVELPALVIAGRAARAERRASSSSATNGSGNGTTAPLNFLDGPPCLENLALRGFPEGTRNRSLFMVGVYARRRDPENWRKVVEEANQQFMKPPLTGEEVAGVLKSLSRRSYHYTCRAEPMASSCNAAVCRTRAHGIGEDGNVPRIAGMSVIDTDPPIWFLDVDGLRVELTTDQLTVYREFNKCCAAQIRRHYQAIKQADWTMTIGTAMAQVVRVEPPPDVGVRDRFREYLEEFLTNRNAGNQQEDVLLGRPWRDEASHRYVFRMRDIQTFCSREKFDIDRGQISLAIEDLGGGGEAVVIKGRAVNLRWLPDTLFAPASSAAGTASESQHQHQGSPI